MHRRQGGFGWNRMRLPRRTEAPGFDQCPDGRVIGAIAVASDFKRARQYFEEFFRQFVPAIRGGPVEAAANGVARCRGGDGPLADVGCEGAGVAGLRCPGARAAVIAPGDRIEIVARGVVAGGAMIASSPLSLIRRRMVSSTRTASNTPMRPAKPV